MRRALLSSVASAILSFFAASAAPAAQMPQGLWYDDTGRGAVEITACGERLCGRIVWLREPTGKDGAPLTDKLNPSKSKRERLICGLQVIGGLEAQADGSWDNGWIYDPKQGKSFDVQLSIIDQGRLKVLGYKGVKFLSKTFTWKRAPDSLERCG